MHPYNVMAAMMPRLCKTMIQTAVEASLAASVKATVYQKEGKGVSSATFFNASFKPLPGFAKAKEFVF